jgi:hypothetical protein
VQINVSLPALTNKPLALAHPIRVLLTLLPITMAGTKKTTGGRRAPHANPVKLAQPGEDDILCGKDRACALHKGSQRFRAVIDSYRATYSKAVTKYDKMCITKEIYEVLSQKARFLKFNEKEKLWEEITPLQGRDKIGHALRFANNHNATTKATKSKRSRKALKRQGSFSSTSATSGTSSAIAPPSKAEMVKNLVEVAIEEPKVMDAIVDHLTLQDALATLPTDGVPSAAGFQEAAAAHHRRVASIVDPVALENIAYAVDTNKADDAALDELISLLNHDDTIQEEDIQDLLDLADDQEVPPTIAIMASFGGTGDADSMASFGGTGDAAAVPAVAASSSLEEMLLPDSAFSAFSDLAPAHARKSSADDDIWSVMKEPILDLDYQW